ncbi:hypothetical protein [Paracidovorax sp. MALMAid1276]|uniref:hypothetical protein n=1 Tax=Paracidovorax sp. MALMAid1276 TaxID=3411631 RepID=UPI003B9C5DB1
MNKSLGATLENVQESWTQTERAAHLAWAKLTAQDSTAAGLMHVLAAQMSENNAVIASRKDLALLIGKSDSTVKRAVSVLKKGKWIEVVQIGGKGGLNSYIINKRAAWNTRTANLAILDANLITPI